MASVYDILKFHDPGIQYEPRETQPCLGACAPACPQAGRGTSDGTRMAHTPAQADTGLRLSCCALVGGSSLRLYLASCHVSGQTLPPPSSTWGRWEEGCGVGRGGDARPGAPPDRPHASPRGGPWYALPVRAKTPRRRSTRARAEV